MPSTIKLHRVLKTTPERLFRALSTPEALVKAGRAHAVREYLDHLALGGFA